jgi:hypothetical protein
MAFLDVAEKIFKRKKTLKRKIIIYSLALAHG